MLTFQFKTMISLLPAQYFWGFYNIVFHRKLCVTTICEPHTIKNAHSSDHHIPLTICSVIGERHHRHVVVGHVHNNSITVLTPPSPPPPYMCLLLISHMYQNLHVYVSTTGEATTLEHNGGSPDQWQWVPMVTIPSYTHYMYHTMVTTQNHTHCI